MMSIETIKDWVQTLAVVVGSLSLAIATTAYLLSRRGLQFNVMIACIERFQDLLPSLDSDDVTERDVLRYMDRNYSGRAAVLRVRVGVPAGR
jgi:hypothetical protein